MELILGLLVVLIHYFSNFLQLTKLVKKTVFSKNEIIATFEYNFTNFTKVKFKSVW